ncbi:MAG: queuosine precursor transporter [Parachlamydiaceae bacterium]|nr:queuosine precursor transporter [Parachlamydiaceae bacterium]
MNEVLFFIETLLVVGFAFWALHLGKAALTGWVAVQALIANLFVLKQISLFGFEVTASDVFAIGSLLGLNFLQEYFSKEDAKKATWICFFFMVFFTFASQIHLLYVPSSFDTTHAAFESILSLSPRLLIASMSVFFVVQQVDIRFFAFLQKSMPGASFAIRAGISLVVSQFLDTFLFSFAGLYGVVASVFDIILLSYLIKLIVVFCFTVCIRIAKS